MRILQVHTRYRQPGGEDTAVENERDLLIAGGHEVHTHLEENPVESGDAMMRLAQAPWNQTAARRVREAADRVAAEVVHVHNTWFSLSPAVFPALSEAGYPVVATIHNYRLTCLNAMLYRNGVPCQDCVGRVPWRGVMRGCYRSSPAQSAVVGGTVQLHRWRRTWQKDVQVMIALTRFAADLLVESGVPPESVEIKPNVVSDPGPRSHPPSLSHTLLFVGRLVEEKGIGDLVDVWRRRPPYGLRLDVVGGPDSARVTGVPGVRFLGTNSPEEVTRMMLEARALIVPSKWYEGQPMVVLEALSSGLPVVVPNLGALPEIVGSGGFVFEGRDQDALANVLDRLGNDQEVMRVGENARRVYQDRYSEAMGLKRLEEVYRIAIERASRGQRGQ